MKHSQNFELFYGTIHVGAIKDAFCGDSTWHGVIDITINQDDKSLDARILEFIAFMVDWNMRAKSRESPDPREFDRYSDLIGTGKWAALAPGGRTRPIVDAPVFFGGRDISWRESPE